MEYVTLNNGVKMPLEGFGVFTIEDLELCEQAVTDAINAGYRLIDTAAAYFNEEAVGKAIKKSGIPREEFFITTKLWVQDYGFEEAIKAFQTSIDNLGVEYLDLYLLHQPMRDYYSTWKALEELYKEGKIRAIGVSNFYPERLADFCLNVDIVPAVNQVELHPFFQQSEAIENMQNFGVIPQAWAPLAEGNRDIFNHPTLVEIGKKYGKQAAQVALRWNIQRGVVIIPKSVNKNRIEQNMDIWDFELSNREMELISRLDIGYSKIIDHTLAATAIHLNQHKVHD